MGRVKFVIIILFCVVGMAGSFKLWASSESEQVQKIAEVSRCAAIIEASGPELTDRLIHGHALMYLDTHSPASVRSVSEQTYREAQWGNILSSIPKDLLAEFFVKLRAEVAELSPHHERAQQAEAEERERRLQDEEEKEKEAQQIADTRTHPVTGKKFIRDYTHPALGEAYRNEQGLIWGAVVKDSDGNVREMSQEKAIKYCTDLGFSLPTMEQFEKLAQDMGRGSAISSKYRGYNSQFIHNGVEVDFLPDIQNRFWSSSVDPNNSHIALDFGGNFGGVGYDSRYSNLSVRCVGGR